MQGCVKKRCYPLDAGCRYKKQGEHTECFYWRPYIETMHIIDDVTGDYLLLYDAEDGWFSIIDEEGDELPGVSFGFKYLDKLIAGLQKLKLATRKIDQPGDV